MFKRKKFMALCATTLAGVSALGSLAPIEAFAYVATTGETNITCTGMPPAEWGLSVPSKLEINQPSETHEDAIYGNIKLAIVASTGEDYKNDFDQDFSVSGTSDTKDNQYTERRMYMKNLKDPDSDLRLSLNVNVLSQGEKPSADVAVPSITAAEESRIQNLTIKSKSDNSMNPELYVQFILDRDLASDLLSKGAVLVNHISWTAMEIPS